MSTRRATGSKLDLKPRKIRAINPALFKSKENGSVDSRSRSKSILNSIHSHRSRDQSLVRVDTRASLTSNELESFHTDFVKAEVEKIFEIALTTVVNMRENVQGDTTRKELLQYIKKVFPVDPVRFDELYKVATEEKISEWKVVIFAVRGTDLEAKDRNGLSDPYIKFGLVQSANKEDHFVKSRNNLTEWEKEDKLVGSVKYTSIKEKTLNPEWNEEVELRFRNIREEELVIEVWDSDGATDEPTKLRELSLKGFTQFLHNAIARDDFIGRAFHPLHEIPVNGEERAFELLSHSKKHRRGSVTLQLSVETTRKNLTQEVGLEEHMILVRGLVNADSRTKQGKYIRDWDGQLSPTAAKLLQQHDYTIGINYLQKKAIKLEVLLGYHKLFGVRMTTFLSLVQKIKSQYSMLEENKATPENEVDQSDLVTADDLYLYPEARTLNKLTETDWETNLFEDLKELLGAVLTRLRRHLTKIRVQDGIKELQTLTAHLGVVAELSTFQPLVQLLEDDQKGMAESVELTVPLAVTDWYSSLDRVTTTKPLKCFENVCKMSLHMCDVALANISPVFNKAPLSVDYFTPFYLALDKLVSDEAVTVLSVYSVPADLEPERDKEEILKTYAIYLSLKSIKALSVNIDPSLISPSGLNLSQMHDWFKYLVFHWIKEAGSRCKDQIEKAIELDKVVEVTNEVKFSSSAVDASGSLIRLLNVRNDLEWPVPSERLMFTVAVVKEATDCAMIYIDTVFESMKVEYIFDSEGKFRATDKLSIILNNMHHLSQVLLHRTDLVAPLSEEEEKNEHVFELHSNVDSLVKGLMENFSTNVHDNISSIVEKILEKIKPDVKVYLQRILDSKEGREVLIPRSCTLGDADCFGAVAPLLDYLTSNLQTLGDYLLTPVFEIILKELWEATVETIEIQAHSISRENKPNNDELYERLLFSLSMLEQFFRADGKGLSTEALENELYRSLVSELEILRLPTKKLMFRFFSDLAKQPNEATLGTVLFTVGYLQEEGVVDVNVLQARKLSADMTFSKKWYVSCLCSLSGNRVNPFVEATLTPEWLFQTSSRDTHKTKRRRDTTSPVFNESLKLPATKVNLEVQGSSLLLSVFNRSLFGNFYSGACIIPCKDIPVIEPTATERTSLTFDGEDDIDRPAQRANFSLPLFRSSEHTIVVRQIVERAKQRDKEALEFLDVYSHIIKSH